MDGPNAGGPGVSAGSIALTPLGRVNRDGIGAMISFTPEGGDTVMQSVVGGSSRSSQHAVEKIFGMGDRDRASVEVLWAGVVQLESAAGCLQLVAPERLVTLQVAWPGPPGDLATPS